MRRRPGRRVGGAGKRFAIAPAREFVVALREMQEMHRLDVEVQQQVEELLEASSSSASLRAAKRSPRSPSR